MDISELKIDRAKQTLRTVRSSAPDEFVRKLADISLLLFDQALQVGGLPNDLQVEFESDFVRVISELADQSQTSADQIARSTVFWPFFFIVRLLLTRLSVEHGFQQTDVELRSFLDVHRGEFLGDEKIRIDYLFNGLARSVLESRARQISAQLQTEAKLVEVRLKAENDRAEKILQSVAQIDERAQKLSLLLKDKTEKLSFIGLSQGFSRMAVETESAIQSPVRLMKSCSTAMLLVPVLGLILPGVSLVQDLEWWQLGAPLLTIELALFFFFRVLLQRYQSLKVQLLQINLRLNLCAFVEEYSEFSSRIRKGSDDRTLEKFEALIFSGITPDPQKVPSQFDGIEHITNLLKATRTGDKS